MKAARANRGWALLAAGLALLLSLALFVPVDVLTVRLPRLRHGLFHAVRVTAGSEVRLSYRHSVEKTPVEGVFTIGPGPVLQAKETRMTSVGSGLPNDRFAHTRRKGEWLVVDEGLARVPGFDFFISALNAPRLAVNDSAVDLATLASGSVIRIDVARIRLSHWLMWRCGKIDWRKDRKS